LQSGKSFAQETDLSQLEFGIDKHLSTALAGLMILRDRSQGAPDGSPDLNAGFPKPASPLSAQGSPPGHSQQRTVACHRNVRSH
jgi:hypothetical protein